MKLARAYSILFAFLVVTSLSGQELPFKNYSNIDGLPTRNVTDIVQDKLGYIWLSTELGIVKFDGYHFTTFSKERGLGDNLINAVYVDPANQVWAGGYNGTLSCLRNGKITVLPNADKEAGEIISVFSFRNTIWVTTGKGLSYVRNDSLLTYRSKDASMAEIPLCYFIDCHQKLWVATINGLFVIDSTFKKCNWPEINNSVIRDIIEDDRGRLWFATQKLGVICFDKGKFSFYNKKNGLSTNIVLSLMSDKDNTIWVGTYYGGISKIKDGHINNIFKIKPGNSEIHQLYKDKYNRIWARTLGNGVFLIENNKITHITKENGLQDNAVTKIFEDNTGNIWISTENGGISKYGKAIFTLFQKDFLNGDNSVNTVVIAKDGRVLSGTYEGLNILEKDYSMAHYGQAAGRLDDPYVISIARGNNNDFWLGTLSGLTYFDGKHFVHYIDPVFFNGYYDIWSNDMVFSKGKVFSATERGLIVFDNSAYKLLDESDGLISNDLYSIAIDKQHNIWCGSSQGLSVYDGDTFHNFTKFNGLPDNFCNDICFDYRGVAWIATDKGLASVVLNHYYGISTRNYSTAEGLGSDALSSVIADSSGDIWIGHNKGVDCLDPKSKKVRNYGVDDGFLPLETKFGAIARGRYGQIWFGTVDGLVRYNPEYDIKSTTPPRVYITSVKLYNDSTDLNKFYTKLDKQTNLPFDLKLKYNHNNLIFDYVGLHYTVVEKNIYKYRLLGYEENWSEQTHTIQSIPYRKLPPGHYSFQVMAANCDGVWNERPAEFSFQIMPPFWQTWWARIIEVLFVIGIFFLIIYLRERKLIHDKKLLTIKVKERTIEIEKQKNQIELQRDEISHQKKEITDSIEYARHIQSAILPKDDTIAPLLRDYFILFKPRDIVSGDFFWISEYGEKVIAIAADCTGHGVPGAFMSMLGVSTLNEITAQNEDLSAGSILDILRTHVIATLSHTKGEDEARDGMDISLCIFDFKNYTVQFAGAFNPLVLIRNREDLLYKADKMPVGLHTGDIKPFTSTSIELHKGDCLYMFSDGFSDQFGGPDGKKFKSVNFRSLLCNISDMPMPDQKETLDKTISDWMQGHEQIDDIMVMGIRVM